MAPALGYQETGMECHSLELGAHQLMRFCMSAGSGYVRRQQESEVDFDRLFINQGALDRLHFDYCQQCGSEHWNPAASSR